MYMMSFKEDYSCGTYKYNEASAEPLPYQAEFFEDVAALYFEREWRMVLSSTAHDLPWHYREGDTTYFKFNEKYLGPIVVPREYVGRFNKERDEMFSQYDKRWIPSVLAYEDLRFM